MKHLLKMTPILGNILIAFLMAMPASAALTKGASPQTDDLEFVRKALKNPNVHEIVIPAGSYTANRPLVMDRDDVSLVGHGEVIITLADHANSPLLILGNVQTPPPPVHNLKVANLILKGNRENQEMECWAGDCDSGDVSFIRNNGITIRGVHGAQINNVQTLSMRSGGIVTEKFSSDLHIDHWISKDNYFDGFAGYQTTGSTFTNFISSENMGAGLSLDIDFGGNAFESGNTLENGEMFKNMDVGIFMRKSNSNNFNSLRIVDSGSHGVFVSQVDDQLGTVPVNNIFKNLVVKNSKGNGFHLNHPGIGNKLIDPQFINVRGKDIYETVPGVLQISKTRNRCGGFLRAI